MTRPGDAARIREIREQSRTLITIGACATAGGIQALRNFADVAEFAALVYPRPEYLQTLATSTAIADHVPVDFELRGCPIDKRQLLEVISAFLAGRKPSIAAHSVCVECKQRGTTCVMVAQGTPCLGPVTQAGCGAICPSFHRECFGCYGPKEQPNLASLAGFYGDHGTAPRDLVQLIRNFNGYAPEFREASNAIERGDLSAGTAG